MTDNPYRRGDSHLSTGSSTARRGNAASSNASHSSITVPDEVAAADQTVVSTAPPLELQPAGRGLKPRELGAALEGQQLDHVLLEQFVGGGGMGAVFRAWDTDLHRTVAVKVLSTHQAGDVESERRFQTEARSAAQLDHPNIARVHYVGEDRGIRYIVFEYIDGTNLRDLLYANGPLRVADALNYTLQIANALVHAWEREIVHRDIKPSNILITPDGLAKLVDMGLARSDRADQAEHEQTATGVTLGTFDYISPEQARNPRDTDARSDIYSLGCTLFFMLTGQPPFPEGSAVQKLLKHQEESPPDPRQFRSDVSDLLAGVLATMLAKRPEDRFQTPTELVAALVGCADQMGIAGPAVAHPAYWSRWSWQSTWWRRNATWLVPSALLVAGVLAMGLLWNREATSPAFTDLQIPAASKTDNATEGPAEKPATRAERSRTPLSPASELPNGTP